MSRRKFSGNASRDLITWHECRQEYAISGQIQPWKAIFLSGRLKPPGLVDQPL
jgi:hypothetical protein